MSGKKRIALTALGCLGMGILFTVIYRTGRTGINMLATLLQGKSVEGGFSDIFTGMFTDKGVWITFAIGIIFGVVIFLTKAIIKKMQGSYDSQRNFTYSKKGTFGTSTFMTDEEFNRRLKATELDETDEFIFGTIE